MKIAFVTPGAFPLPPSKSGSVEIVVHGLAEELAKHTEVIVFSKHEQGKISHTKNGKRIDIRIPYISKNQYLSQIKAYIVKTKPSCIQIDNRPLYLWQLKTMLPTLPMNLSLHSLTFIERLSAPVAEKALQAADLITVNSKFIKQQLAERFPSVAHKIKVRYLGIAAANFYDRYSIRGKRMRKKWRTTYRLNGKKVILFVGRLIPEKGLHLLLQSFPTLLQRFPNLHLLIVGSSHYGKQRMTPYVKKLRTLIQPIAKHVTFTNYVSPAIVPQLYPTADVVVTPSIGKEAFCLVNVEAAISGIPVVTTEVGGIPEVVSHDVSGYVIHPDQWQEQFETYIISLLEDAELNESMGKSAQKLALKRFTWQGNIKRYHRLYAHLLTSVEESKVQSVLNDRLNSITNEGEEHWESLC